MKKYTKKINEKEAETIELDNENGSFLSIPIDESNSDYQGYLAWLENPEAEQFTPSVIDEA
jgi:hypothetical protein